MFCVVMLALILHHRTGTQAETGSFGVKARSSVPVTSCLQGFTRWRMQAYKSRELNMANVSLAAPSRFLMFWVRSQGHEPNSSG